MISIQGIHKTYYQNKVGYKALDDIHLDVSKGEILGIIGKSGAGKSTLIRCINYLEVPDRGKVVIANKDLASMSNKQLAEQRKKIGMIFQHFNLLSSRTVAQNIALPMELDKKPKAHIARKVDELLELVGLEEKRNEYPAKLSGGQKQRVAIARALANDPYLLLCDEATSALDPATTDSILALLKDINRRLAITIVLITHEMEVIKAICQQVAVIDGGKIHAKTSLEELFLMKDHPIIKQFIKKNVMTIPQDISEKIQSNFVSGLFPIIEIELVGMVPFDKVIKALYEQYQVPFKLIKADVEYIGKANYGKILIHLQGDQDSQDKALLYFQKNNILNTIKGYA